MSNYPFFDSPNKNERLLGLPITFLILHYTVIDFEATKKEFLKPNSYSAHYVVNTDGKIYQFVKDEMRAYHAGIAFFSGVADINAASLGIEIVNPGFVEGKPIVPYPEVQVQAVISLSQTLIKNYKIKPYFVVGHSDIAVGRKIDPGPHFPWIQCAKNGVGLFPTPSDITKYGNSYPNYNLDDLLRLLGYKRGSETAISTRAFQLHYNPANWLKKIPFGKEDEKIMRTLLYLKYHL